MGALRDHTEDSVQHVALALARARQGTEFLHATLGQITDAELDGDSLLPGWELRQVVAHVISNARALGRLAYWADTGIETVMYASLEARNAETAAGSVLSPDLLRESMADTAADLNHGAGFADLPEEVLERRLGDIVGAWAARGDTSRLLSVTDPAHHSYGYPDAAEQVTGSLADLAGWATGRTRVGVISDTGETPVAPRWL